MSRWICTIIAAVIGAVALCGPASKPARAENPSLVLDRIKASGKLKFPVMVAEEPGYIRDPELHHRRGAHARPGGARATVRQNRCDDHCRPGCGPSRLQGRRQGRGTDAYPAQPCDDRYPPRSRKRGLLQLPGQLDVAAE